MNRGAVVGFLALAALVGASASLDERQLTAFGAHLLAWQGQIDEASQYTSMRGQSAAGNLAFLEAGDDGGWGVPSYFYDGGYGSPADFQPPPTEPVTLYNYSYDGGYGSPTDFQVAPTAGAIDWGDPDGWGVLVQPNSGPYPTYQYSIEPQTSSNFDVPADGFSVPYVNPGDPDGIGVLVTPSTQSYPVQVTDMTELPTQDYPYMFFGSAQNAQVYQPSVGSPALQRAIGGSLPTQLYDESYAYAPTTYMLGTPTSNTYQPAWYETAFPGWGSAVIPLLPTQYRPDYSYQSYDPLLAPYSVYASSYVQPTCTIALSDATIDYGGSTVLSWAARDASNATLNGFGAVPLTGTRMLSNQTTSRTYGLSLTGVGGVGACYTALTVRESEAPTCQISAHPSTIKKGQSANLAWLSVGAVRATLSGFGDVPVKSGRTVTPKEDTTYTLTVKNAANRVVQCAVTVAVQ